MPSPAPPSLHAVIMAGGAGTRFWPASRKRRPKQFLPLCHGRILLAATIDRLAGLCPPDQVWIVTNPQQAKAIGRLLPGFRRDRIVVEPEARDTAPCVALATATIAAVDPGATMVVLPADHVIEPEAEFHRMLRRGAAIAATGALVTFGVQPTHPATGYGYIECGAAHDDGEPRAFAARRFREKPDLATARQFVQQGGFLWNSGIFVWTVDSIRRAMQHGDPALGEAAERMLAAARTGQRAALNRAFRRAPKTSIDYAVMERAERVVTVEATVRWDDVGAFPAIAAVGTADDAGNHALLAGGAAQLALQSEGNIVYAEGRRTVALFGVRDLVVVAVGDAVLVCPKDRAGDLKAMVEHVRAAGRDDLL
ncbi:MAG: NTP transferase domain-containing protein [Planctomycetes bacterium]|nr:NTP transferase domain-containing protein [Planctomycetota bacterium]